MGNQFKDVPVIGCLQTLVLIFNIIYWLVGLVILGAGLWAELDLHKYMELSPEFSGTGPHLMIGLASLIIFICSLAFSCIIRGQSVLLYLYMSFLFCIFVMNVGMAISVACYRQTFTKGLFDGLTQTVQTYNSDKANFDFAQSTLQCCGVSNYTDWIRSSPMKVIPTSCCVDPTHCVTANYSDVYPRGCYEVIVEYLTSNMNMLICVAVSTALLPLMGCALASTLASNIAEYKCNNMINIQTKGYST